MKQKKAKKFHFECSPFERNITKIKSIILREITKKSIPIFFRGGDVGHHIPLVSGNYEIQIKELIHFLSTQRGYGDFLIDIGANIGLISCQVGKLFKEVHLFEPNPDCVNILKVNLRICLHNHPYTIHNYALGDKDEYCDLYIPIHNWGGAFIQSESNSYDEKELTRKDNLVNFNQENYLISKVEIQNSKTALQKLFNDLKARNLTKGVVKIDVEGFEKVVINAISKVMPNGFELTVLFENWSNRIKTKDLLPEDFSGRSELFMMDEKKFAKSEMMRSFSQLIPKLKQHKRFYLRKFTSNKLCKGDFVMYLSKD